MLHGQADFAYTEVQSSRSPTATFKQFGGRSRNRGRACQRCEWIEDKRECVTKNHFKIMKEKTENLNLNCDWVCGALEAKIMLKKGIA